MKNKKTSWVTIPKNSDFTIYNLPYGIFSCHGKTAVGVAIGDMILDMEAVAQLGYLDSLDIDLSVFSNNTLNNFIDLGKSIWTKTRQKLIELLSESNNLSSDADKVLVAMKQAEMLLPVKIGDYTDFYSSKEHATNLGKMFRDPDNALMPNWKSIPVGYHGRASSIIVSGTNIHRPKGQTKPIDHHFPVYGACKAMDFELEMAFITGKSTELGSTVSTTNAKDHIFGLVLFNDWSARDIQKWEYVPLGPFLGKNFGSSISPWIVTMEALEPYRVDSPEQDLAPILPYLQCKNKNNSFDINLEVFIQPEGSEESKVCSSNFKYMYWNIYQQLAHHTVNGCNINVGDMMASGTLSGKTEDSYGSMIELSWGW